MDPSSLAVLTLHCGSNEPSIGLLAAAPVVSLLASYFLQEFMRRLELYSSLSPPFLCGFSATGSVKIVPHRDPVLAKGELS